MSYLRGRAGSGPEGEKDSKEKKEKKKKMESLKRIKKDENYRLEMASSPYNPIEKENA